VEREGFSRAFGEPERLALPLPRPERASPTVLKITFGWRRARPEIAHRVSVRFDGIAQRSDGAVGAAAYGIASDAAKKP